MSRKQVLEVMKKMAKIVDNQNLKDKSMKGQAPYQSMGKNITITVVLALIQLYQVSISYDNHLTRAQLKMIVCKTSRFRFVLD